MNITFKQKQNWTKALDAKRSDQDTDTFMLYFSTADQHRNTKSAEHEFWTLDFVSCFSSAAVFGKITSQPIPTKTNCPDHASVFNAHCADII